MIYLLFVKFVLEFFAVISVCANLVRVFATRVCIVLSFAIVCKIIKHRMTREQHLLPGATTRRRKMLGRPPPPDAMTRLRGTGSTSRWSGAAGVRS